eukprot:CAMPEP_0206508512 /NCGR_PEP_ID=MMETSP0324_2-20121206/58390_1 /ASSEMBLY_ACC=CAM_ASM_000836 /TAXON_ID=2866 /ORGANISM="Crypthecodinium cohnii, Strain Seligo" /LENGTH=37 /DNA_ID= /DNA_START= /DNA_END= /DNA_ORIENTATION=
MGCCHMVLLAIGQDFHENGKGFGAFDESRAHNGVVAE